MSLKMIAASMSGWYRSIGWSVIVLAISGDRQISKKSRFPLVALYSVVHRKH